MSGHSDDRPPILLADPQSQTETEKIAQSILPYSRDDPKARYLSLRSSGFTIREALRLIGYAHSTLSKWREVPEFVALEERIPEFRQQLSLEYAGLEFVRNFRLVLEKDLRVLQKSLYPERDGDGKPLPMPDEEQSYLLKLRAFYTPQQLQIMEALLKGQTATPVEGEFDFTKFVMTAARTREELRVEVVRGNGGNGGKETP
ncbi:MAG: hypothetical protein WC291_03680 [Thermodesulfovibrionales bacterium]|jgi:hypothetical protein